MKPELENKLFEGYPSIFRQKDLPKNQSCMYWGIDTGDGWYNILDTLCNQIQNHLEHNLQKDQDPAGVNVEATQVKEKFGGLRFYYSGGDEFIEGLVWMAEAISGRTCEECGSPGTPNNTGWIKTLCPSCREKDNIMNKTDTKEQNNDHYTTIVQKNEAGELYIELPQKMMDQLGWEIGDDIEWGETEICEDWGEHKGFTLSNLTKNPKVVPSE